MADLTYDVRVNTTQAESSLKKLDTRISDVTTAFSRLQTLLIGGLGVGAAVTGVLRFADSISDLSDATGIAIGNILGFTDAVVLNGGSAEGAQKGILRFVSTIEDAASGSKEAQMAFLKAGISLKELSTLSEQALFDKFVKSLNGASTASERLATAQRFFGKEMRGVNLANLGQAYVDAAAASARYEAAIAKIGPIQDTLDTNLKNLKIALVEVIAPIADLSRELIVTVKQFKLFIETIVSIAAVAASLFVIVRVVRLIYAGILLLVEAGAGVMAMWTTVVNFFRNAGLIIRELFSSWRASVALFGEALSALAPIGKVFAASLAVIAGAFVYVSDGISNAIDKIKEFFGFASKDPRKDFRKQEIADAEALRKKEEERGRLQRQVQTDFAKFKFNQEEIVRSYEDANRAIVQQIAFETKLVGKSEQEVEVLRAREEVLKRQVGIIQDLQRQQDQLRLELDTDPTAAAKIEAINVTIRRLWNETAAAQDVIQSYIEKNQSARLIEQDRINTLDQLQQRLQKQAEIQQVLTRNYQDYQAALTQAQREGAALTMGKTEEALANIQAQAKDAALAAGRAFAEMFDGEDLSAEQAQQLADGLKVIEERYKKIAEVQTANVNKSREGLTGLQKAFADFKDSATNDAEYMADIFGTFTRGFGDSIVKMVQTGKLSFRDLANDLLAQVARMAANRLLLSIFGGMLGGGGAGGSIFGNLFGGFFANGGTLGAGKFGIAGENGPELIHGPANITPLTAAGPTQVVYNIQAVDASSFRALVARDPEFIFNVTEQGRRSLPTRSRR